ncbi:unnamed protein product, partial [Nesidiocoris tenuis]
MFSTQSCYGISPSYLSSYNNCHVYPNFGKVLSNCHRVAQPPLFLTDRRFAADT